MQRRRLTRTGCGRRILVIVASGGPPSGGAFGAAAAAGRALVGGRHGLAPFDDIATSLSPHFDLAFDTATFDVTVCTTTVEVIQPTSVIYKW